MIQFSEYFQQAEFSINQARNFTDTYYVMIQYTDVTGLSATVFADKVSGETFLAIRGTEASDLMDLLTDLIDITWLGSTTLQPQYISLRSKVAEWLENGTLPQNFTVTGHSLGGFLAAGLVAEPVLADHISHAYLFNNPGGGGHSGPFAMVLRFWIFSKLHPHMTNPKSVISKLQPVQSQLLD